MRVAVVVGNSDGIGLAVTRSMLEEGWRVVGISRRPSPIASCEDGVPYAHHELDVCGADYGQRLERIVAEIGAIDVCVYCAGIGQFLDLEAMREQRTVFETNLLGAVVTAEVILPSMVTRKRGHLIGLSSQADSLIDAHAPSYAASKAGLSSYLEGLALACRPHGVCVTNLRFGFVDTKLAKATLRPFMLSKEQAARRILRDIERRPLRDTYPKSMALLLVFFRALTSVRRWFL
jgi:NAD(P)-dependent dehydrogenase (short-subunit alcohol dehydrogenase family)